MEKTVCSSQNRYLLYCFTSYQNKMFLCEKVSNIHLFTALIDRIRQGSLEPGYYHRSIQVSKTDELHQFMIFPKCLSPERFLTPKHLWDAGPLSFFFFFLSSFYFSLPSSLCLSFWCASFATWSHCFHKHGDQKPGPPSQDFWLSGLLYLLSLMAIHSHNSCRPVT